MKKNDISRLDRLRSGNLRIGFAVAIALAIVAFNWTIERPPLPGSSDETRYDEAEVKIIRTSQSTPASKPQPATFELTDKIVELPEVTFAEMPAIIASDTNLSSPTPEVFAARATEPTEVALPKPKEPEAAPIFKIVEEMPRFPGCEEEGLTKKEAAECATGRLLEFLGQHIRYPALARENGIGGTVVVRFIVEKDGSISNVKVVRDIGGGCGAEALRVVQSMPDWLPGKQQGRPVRVQFNLPVKFRLN